MKLTRHKLQFTDMFYADQQYILDCFKKIPSYASLKHIFLNQVDLSTIIPLAKFISKDRLEFTKGLFFEMKNKGIELYKPIFLKTLEKDYRLIVPPVLERHNNKWYIFDGLHRLWLAREKGEKYVWTICVEHPPLPLPSTPRDWGQITYSDSSPSVSENLLEMKEELVRPLSKMFKSDITIYKNI
ncbi:MAG: hypothetical protein ACD_50C00389G0008 [uncultured bacterium]|nr:MAG: hypothetical protein ACD_50C00389G0008 [uncultured bacterium]